MSNWSIFWCCNIIASVAVGKISGNEYNGWLLFGVLGMCAATFKACHDYLNENE